MSSSTLSAQSIKSGLAGTLALLGVLSSVSAAELPESKRDTIQESQPSAPQSAIARRVETYVDRFFPDHLTKTHTPGATFILVDRNGPLVLRGYGKHSYENGDPIEPDKHLFRIASITKTMTGLGVMKLVNEGKIDMDADVNEYFTRFQIPDTFAQPITTRHLLQHNSGISDEFVHLNFTEITASRSMGDFLEVHVPQRFFPPGKYGSYTNRAFMLLGHMIEEVSGQPYEEWMTEHLFQPLGMNSTGFSLTSEQEPWFTVGSFYEDGEYRKQTSIDTITRPSGDAISTASDMGRYASMLLNDGVIDGQAFLKPETAKRIFSDCFSHHDIFDKACLSIAKSVLPDGSVSFRHSGHYGGWYSDFAFFPEQGVGYFVGTNSDAPFVEEFRMGIAQEITGHLLETEHVYEFADKIDGSDALVGNYRNQFLGSTFEKIYHLIVGDDKVELKDPSTLLLKGKEYRQVEPLIFRNASSGSPLVFVENSQGKIERFLARTGWFSIGERLAGWETAEFQLAWLKTAHVLCGLSVLLMLGAFAHRSTRIRVAAASGRWLPGLLLLTNLLWLSPIAVLWFTNTTDIMAITLGLTVPMKAAFGLIDLAVASTVVFGILALTRVFAATQSFASRLLLSLSLANCAGLIFWVSYWNLITNFGAVI